MNDTSVRVKAIYYLLRTPSNLNENFFTTFLKKLIEKDKFVLSVNQKFYINSQIHRERFRLWQTIITLLPKIHSVI